MSACLAATAIHSSIILAPGKRQARKSGNGNRQDRMHVVGLDCQPNTQRVRYVQSVSVEMSRPTARILSVELCLRLVSGFQKYPFFDNTNQSINVASYLHSSILYRIHVFLSVNRVL